MNDVDEKIFRHMREERARRNEELRQFLERSADFEDLITALSRLKGFNVEERKRAAEAV